MSYTPHIRLDGIAGTHASTPDSAALDITGDIDIRCRIALDDWDNDTTLDLVEKWNSYRFAVTAADELFLRVWDSTVIQDFTSTGFTPPADGTTKWVRATLDVDNGTSQHVVTFYDSDNGTSWNQIDQQTTAGTLTIDTNTDTLYMGKLMVGELINIQVLDGIGGTAALDADFGVLTLSELAAASFLEDANSATVTLNGGWSDGPGELFNDDVRIINEIGFDATGPLDATFTWTDITTYLRGFGTKRGRSHERDTVSAGTARFLLDNADRRFEPDYSSGAYYPNIRPMRPIRLRAIHNSTMYELWRGYIEGFPQLWPAQTDAVVALTAVDAFKVFAWNEITDAEVQELSGTRIGNLLDSAGWPAGARSIDTGDYQVQAHTPVCVPALGELQRIVKTEDGLFFMDGNGDAVFHDNSHRTGASSQGTFNDDGTGLAYIDIQLGYDDLQIWNDITVAAVNTAPQAAADATSVTEFGRRKLKVFDTLHISAANALTVAQGIRDRYKDPGIRVIAITLDPRYDPTVLWPEVLTRELGDLMTVKRTPPAGGTQISSTVFIEGIDHTADAATRTWRTSYLLSPGT